ncbi:hypothetical protein BH10PLA2_BH10PLA2_14760 [soil metagenome]
MSQAKYPGPYYHVGIACINAARFVANLLEWVHSPDPERLTIDWLEATNQDSRRVFGDLKDILAHNPPGDRGAKVEAIANRTGQLAIYFATRIQDHSEITKTPYDKWHAFYPGDWFEELALAERELRRCGEEWTTLVDWEPVSVETPASNQCESIPDNLGQSMPDVLDAPKSDRTEWETIPGVETRLASLGIPVPTKVIYAWKDDDKVAFRKVSEGKVRYRISLADALVEAELWYARKSQGDPEIEASSIDLAKREIRMRNEQTSLANEKKYRGRDRE